ncbi:unnamed protein product [Cuscuta campestris]|uniref:Uncharacterized protein n=1 Tax=Cuscuta campestris TaxID=132261 RepID=A0A484LLE7_9ASTE|nr:unnamed protein product [Cuscuta campestris]
MCDALVLEKLQPLSFSLASTSITIAAKPPNWVTERELEQILALRLRYLFPAGTKRNQIHYGCKTVTALPRYRLSSLNASRFDFQDHNLPYFFEALERNAKSHLNQALKKVQCNQL